MSDQPLALVNADHQTALARPDPDNPQWGLIGGVCIWLLSFSLPQVVPVPYLLIARQAGKVVIPTPEDLSTGNLDVRFIIISLVSTLIIHIIMLAVCWAVVTQFRRLPFFATLGWHWAGMPLWMRIMLVIWVLGLVFLINIFLPYILPDTQTTPFAHILRSSKAAKYLVVGVAVLTAPFVEELVYRGMLYSGLRSRLPESVSILVVTLVFAIVHIQQYWGAWSSLIGLTTLSLSMTVIRAKTKSLLPCVVIHQVNNTIAGLLILAGVE
ncbi:MAG TPA: type II CAAX endopeptidase family protein [Blastocatellia bacterium]|nr:type II CAAX endopeptidase family protein [Blastocatellia bacterium]